MSIKYLRVAASLLALAAAGSAANAGDLVGTSGVFRDTGGSPAIPVPAPVPIAEKYNWYLRFDAGMGFPNNPGVSEQGAVYGNPAVNGIGVPAGNTMTGNSVGTLSQFGNQASWFGTGLDPNRTFGAGIGYYFAPHWRGDVTIDNRSPMQVAKIGGTYQYLYAPTAAPAGPQTTVNGSVSDRTTLRGGIGLANLYYDFNDRGGFVPYVGVGLGAVVHRIDRNSEATELTYDSNNNLVSSVSFGGRDTQYAGAFAAAVTTGFSYEFDPQWAFDVNYRFLYTGGASATFALSNGAQSTIRIGDMTEHQIRAGIRWNVW